jgi:trk system potassium uptake protein
MSERFILKSKNQSRSSNLYTTSRILAMSFAVLILLGAVLLSLPLSTTSGEGIPFIDALFTATSAVCVTGLVVVDTGSFFTVFGQVVILFLIQIGGLGFMTFATVFAILLGKKINLKERLFLQEALNQLTLQGVVKLVKYIFIFSLSIELLGAIILALRWSFDMHWTKAIYYGLFHSISAFNNAGFDLFGSSLMKFKGDITINFVIMGLFIVGGLGFAVLVDLYNHKGRKFNLHTRLVLRTTILLLIVGSVLIFVLERGNPNTMGSLNFTAQILTSVFQSAAPRTAGFNSLDMPSLRDTTQLLIIILMFIGASPGSTGGGIKTTTFVSILLSIRSTFSNNRPITIEERTIPKELIQKAFVVTTLAMFWVMFVTGILTITEEAELRILLFEAVSAFATTGLSLGITPHLTSLGKIAVILSMFAGRVGLLTLVFALGKKHAAINHLKYAEERIIIG